MRRDLVPVAAGLFVLLLLVTGFAAQSGMHLSDGLYTIGVDDPALAGAQERDALGLHRVGNARQRPGDRRIDLARGDIDEARRDLGEDLLEALQLVAGRRSRSDGNGDHGGAP